MARSSKVQHIALQLEADRNDNKLLVTFTRRRGPRPTLKSHRYRLQSEASCLRLHTLVSNIHACIYDIDIGHFGYLSVDVDVSEVPQHGLLEELKEKL